MEKTTQQVQEASHDKTPGLSDTYILDPLPVKSIRVPMTRPLRVVPIDWDALNAVLPQKDGEKPFAIRVHETIKQTRAKLDSARKGAREDTLNIISNQHQERSNTMEINVIKMCAIWFMNGVFASVIAYLLIGGGL